MICNYLMMKYFKDLDVIQKIELSLLTLLVIVIPFYWRVASYMVMILLLFGFFKIVFIQKFKFNKQQLKYTFAYIVFAATWLIYLIGVFYSSDVSSAWEQIGKKLFFLLLPLYFLFSDLSFITQNRLRYLLYVLTFSLVAVFLVDFSIASFNHIFNEKTMYSYMVAKAKIFDSHHTYTSMYICLAIVFLFVEIFTVKSARTKLVDIICSVILVIGIFFQNSRAGILCMTLLFIALIIWVVFVLKKKKIALYVFLSISMFIVASCFVFKNSFNRFVDTFHKLTNENKTDTRVVLYQVAKSVIGTYYAFGTGTGDRIDVIVDEYHDYKDELLNNIEPVNPYIENFDNLKIQCLDSISKMFSTSSFDSLSEEAIIIAKDYGCQPQTVECNLIKYKIVTSAIKNEANSHNQYFDTLISVGIIGLLLMLSFFVLPLVLMIKRKKYDIVYLSFMFIILFNAVFESIFERQLGIIFFLLFYLLFFHVTFCQNNNKLCSLPKNC